MRALVLLMRGWVTSLLGVVAIACAATPAALPPSEALAPPPMVPPAPPAPVPAPPALPTATSDAQSVTPPPEPPPDEPAPAAVRPPVPHRPGPCPAPSPAATNLFQRSSALAESTQALSSHRAISEAVRMRLDEIYKAGCRPSLDDDHLRAEVEALGKTMAGPPTLFLESLDAYTTMVGHATSNGGSVAMYTWSSDAVRTRIDVTSDGLDMEQRLLLLDATVFQPPGAREPLLAIANTHHWMASCWRSLRLRVLAPSGDPLKPKALLDRPDDGRWCEGVDIQVQGPEVRFHFLDWGGALTMGQVMRPVVHAFHVDGAAATERFGFPPGPEHLVEDWLSRPWSLSREATDDSARDRLEPVHADLARKVAQATETLTQGDPEELTYELFPAGAPTKRKLVVYCALGSGAGPCPDWPKPVDFALEQDSGRWRIKDVKPRP